MSLWADGFCLRRISVMKNALVSVVRFIDAIDTLSNQVGGWMIAFIMILTGTDVFLRAIFNKAIEGSYTLSEVMMAAICFVSLAYTQKQTSHISMDFVVARLQGRRFDYAEITSLSLSLIISVLLAYRAVVEAFVAVDLRLVTPGIMKWPAWPSKIVVAYGFLFLSARILVQLVHTISRTTSKR
jgi:TRAP-type mannitol/chloroaromatic compound transport system permease small subunit